MMKFPTSSFTLIQQLVTLMCIFTLSNLSAQEIIKAPWTLGYKPDQTILYTTIEDASPLKLDIFFPQDHAPNQQRPIIVFFLVVVGIVVIQSNFMALANTSPRAVSLRSLHNIEQKKATAQHQKNRSKTVKQRFVTYVSTQPN